MNRDRLGALVVALLAVLALGAAAATLESTADRGVGVGSGRDTGVGGGDDGSLVLGGEADPGGPADTVSIPPYVLGLLLVVLVVLTVVGAYAAYDQYGLRPLAVLLGTGLVAVLAYLALSGRATVTPQNGTGVPLLGNRTDIPGGAGLAPATSEDARVQVHVPTALAGLLAVAVLAALAVVGRTGPSRTAAEEPEPDPPAPEPDIEAVGRAAGRAADELAGPATVENAVYRAWLEMTDALEEPDPATGTPREFERAAVAAGMDPDDVAELTRLFEAVRYGGAAPTAAREERAARALRRIERTYAEGDR